MRKLLLIALLLIPRLAFAQAVFTSSAALTNVQQLGAVPLGRGPFKHHLLR